jgi:hypothetical protein
VSKEKTATLPELSEADDDLLTTAANMPADTKGDARSLLRSGWSCEGDPNGDGPRWYRPGANLGKEIATGVPRFGYVCRPTGVKDQNGQMTYAYILENLKQQDGQSTTGTPTESITQLRIVPTATPITREQAVRAERFRRQQKKEKALQSTAVS